MLFVLAAVTSAGAARVVFWSLDQPVVLAMLRILLLLLLLLLWFLLLVRVGEGRRKSAVRLSGLFAVPDLPALPVVGAGLIGSMVSPDPSRPGGPLDEPPEALR